MSLHRCSCIVVTNCLTALPGLRFSIASSQKVAELRACVQVGCLKANRNNASSRGLQACRFPLLQSVTVPQYMISDAAYQEIVLAGINPDASMARWQVPGFSPLLFCSAEVASLTVLPGDRRRPGPGVEGKRSESRALASGPCLSGFFGISGNAG